MKEALRSRDTLRLETIRGVRGAIRNKEIEIGESLGEDGILRVIRALVKQRSDSIEQFRAAGRDDLVEKESAERAVLKAYLPAAPDEADPPSPRAAQTVPDLRGPGTWGGAFPWRQ